MSGSAPVGQVPAGSDSAALQAVSDLSPLPTAVTAFVGRTLKGPVNEPVTVTSFAQYVQVFGGLWRQSPLSYSVDQYFAHGGKVALVVRVANGGSAPTIDLPAGEGSLVLQGLCPGSREYLRASVDYQLIDGDEQFNLVVQRLRAPGSELVEQQEIFRRVSLRPGAPRNIETVLASSRLVRLRGALPAARPLPTSADTRNAPIGYVDCNADGSDGQALSDYDLIGSAEAQRGLFALQSAQLFNFLCVPPPGPDQDLGLATVFVAERLCRQRQAVLLIDPPRSWVDAATALAQLPQWPVRSADALMCFPPVSCVDALGAGRRRFGPSAVVAGLLARADAAALRWWQGAALQLQPDDTSRPAVPVSAVQRTQLARFGVNTLVDALDIAATRLPVTTLVDADHRVERRLLARRMQLWIAASIERSTRWSVSAAPSQWDGVREKVARQVLSLLTLLSQERALAAAGLIGEGFVVCDRRLNPDAASAAAPFRLIWGVTGSQSEQGCAWLVTHQAAGSSSRPVSVNRLSVAGARVATEIEADILRNISR